MKRLFYSLFLLAFIACQIEDDNAPAPEDNFIKYYGDFADQEASTFAPIFGTDGSEVTGFVLLGSQQSGDSASNYYVVETDPAGNFVNSNFFSTNLIFDFNEDGQNDVIDADSRGAKILVLENGFLVVGTSSYSNNAVGASDWNFINIALLNSDLQVALFPPIAADPINRMNPENQNFTRDIIANDAIFLSDGSLLIVGSLEKADESDFDFFARKSMFNPASEVDPFAEVWTYFDGFGTGTDDVFIKAFENADGSISLIGYSNDLGENGELGVNVTYLRLNENGNIVNSNSIGFPDETSLEVRDDVPSDAVQIDGGYVIVGTSTTSDNVSSAFVIGISTTGELGSQTLFESDVIVSGTGDQVVRNQTRATGVSISRGNDIIVVGEYPDFRNGITDVRAGEALFFRGNQGGQAILGTETNFGIRDGNDIANDVITLPDGKIMMLATMDFGGGIKLMSLLKLNDTGRLDP